jgi:predicted lipid-binding transport protein (Tim44 family)
MKSIKDYIDQLKEMYKLDSYYKAMKFINMDRQAWTTIQKGSGISDKNALRLAQALKIDPIEIMAISNALKAENNEVRDVWLKLAKLKEEARTEKEETEIICEYRRRSTDKE